MNRRQKKKAYKKRYGHNPPVKSYYYQTYGIDIQNMLDALEKGIKNAFVAAKKVIEAVAKNITAVWKNTKENIQTMTEEEYVEFLEELPLEAKGWAEAIRRKKK